MKHSTLASRWNADLIDQNYETWLSSPDSLTPEWRAFFEGFELAQSSSKTSSATTTDYSAFDTIASKQSRLIGAIYAYRSIGHTIAKFNPLTKEAPMNPRLTLERLGLEESDLDTVFHTGNYLNGVEMTARELLDRLDKTYCHTVGFEYIHIQETPRRRWLQARIEPECFIPSFTKGEKERIVRTIMQAEDFENFLQTRYVGQKRFSLEGGETLIACLESIFERCGQNKVDEIVMGMAHRGRLNVLANFLGKSFEYIFREFSENYIPDTIHGDGDVKYHLGFETKRNTSAGHPVEIRLAANPSHLEAVDPVVQGKARARQRIIGDMERKRVLPVLIHGDAAIAGQGVVSEVFNFSQLPGYRTGGTIHLVVNNQIGFTTGPDEARSSRYCTDVAKIVDAPIFHVNGNDPLATIAAIEAAFDYRQTFGSDVVIDMYCWRKHGHNESDEPAFTQPTLYKKISSMQPIGRALGDRLVASGEFTREEIDTIEADYHARLEAAYEIAKKEESLKGDLLSESSAKQQPPYNFKGFDTRVPKAQLKHIAERLVQFPEGFNANKKIIRQLNTKLKAFNADSRELCTQNCACPSFKSSNGT